MAGFGAAFRQKTPLPQRHQVCVESSFTRHHLRVRQHGGTHRARGVVVLAIEVLLRGQAGEGGRKCHQRDRERRHTAAIGGHGDGPRLNPCRVGDELENLTLQGVIGSWVGPQIPPAMHARAQQAAVLPRAVVVECGRRLSPPLQGQPGRRVERRMDAAQESALGEACPRQDVAGRLGMPGLAAVRGGDEGQLSRREPQRFYTTGLDYGHCLERFGGRAHERHTLRVANARYEAAIGIGDGDGAEMRRLRLTAAGEFHEPDRFQMPSSDHTVAVIARIPCRRSGPPRVVASYRLVGHFT